MLMRETNKYINKKINVSYADAEGAIAAEFAYVYPRVFRWQSRGADFAQTAKKLQQYADSGFDIQGTRLKGKIEVLKMGRIYYVMGKSCSGKDTIYRRLAERHPELCTVIPYTTRPIREGERTASNIFL